MKISSFATLDSFIGKLTIKETDGFITAIYFENEAVQIPEGNNPATALLCEAKRQLAAYFSGALKSFDLPYKTDSPEFSQSVYRELVKIPYGELRTYKDIAKNVGSPNACRAVGNANNKNPLPIIIPCHRVVGSDGRLTGFRAGLDIKSKLLSFEKSHS